ncbi:MAG: DNA adenine methylase [Phycisphaerae bacterium]
MARRAVPIPAGATPRSAGEPAPAPAPTPPRGRRQRRAQHPQTPRSRERERPDASANHLFPRTRYQGSKRKLAGAIVRQVSDLDFTTVLDAFGGTGAVAYEFKRTGKSVTYNDVLAFNHQIGLALIENDTVTLTPAEMKAIGRRYPGVDYPDFIERTFDGIYFTTEENRWLDTAVTNIWRIECPFKRALAWFALFQSAMVKRPYNLFHRRNLYMRAADVPRSFGNKASWDRDFDYHFTAFARQGNAAVLDTGGRCRASCRDALTIEPAHDLVYIDTPYINRSGVGVNYRQFYHFLEGVLRYDDWGAMIDYKSNHRRLLPEEDPWSSPRTSREMFMRLFQRFRSSILVVSYRSEGIPTIDELADMLRSVKRHVRVITGTPHQYALSTNRDTREVLLIATD